MNESVSVTLTEDDVVALSDYYYKHTPGGRRRDRLMKSLPILAALLLVVGMSTDPEWGIHNPGRYALYVGTGVPIVAGLGWLSLWYLRPSLTRWSVQHGLRSRMLDPLTLTLAEDALLLDTQHGTGRAPWSGVQGTGRTDGHIFILFSGPNGFVAPRRYFRDDAHYDAFWEGLQQRCRTGET